MCLSLDGQEHFRMPSAQKASTLPFFMKRLMPACIVDAQSQMMEKEKPFISKDPSVLIFLKRAHIEEFVEISHYFCLCAQSK